MPRILQLATIVNSVQTKMQDDSEGEGHLIKPFTSWSPRGCEYVAPSTPHTWHLATNPSVPLNWSLLTDNCISWPAFPKTAPPTHAEPICPGSGGQGSSLCQHWKEERSALCLAPQQENKEPGMSFSHLTHLPQEKWQATNLLALHLSPGSN